MTVPAQEDHVDHHLDGACESDLNVHIPPLSSLPTNPRILADVNFQRYLYTNPMRPPHYSAGSRFTPVRELPRFEEWNEIIIDSGSKSGAESESVCPKTHSLRYLKWLQGNLRQYGGYVIEDGEGDDDANDGNANDRDGNGSGIPASRDSTGVTNVLTAIDRLRNDFRQWRNKSSKHAIDDSQEGMNLVPFYPELFVFPKSGKSSPESSSENQMSSAAPLPEIAGLGVRIGPMFGKADHSAASASDSTVTANNDSNPIHQIQQARSGIFQLADATERHLEAILKGTSTAKLSLTGSGGWDPEGRNQHTNRSRDRSAQKSNAPNEVRDSTKLPASVPQIQNREAMWISFRTRGIGDLRNTYLDHWHTDFDVNRCKMQMEKLKKQKVISESEKDGEKLNGAESTEVEVPCDSITSNQGEEVLEEFVLTWLPFLCSRLRNYKVEYDCSSNSSCSTPDETDTQRSTKDAQMRTLRKLVSSPEFPDESTVMRITDLVQESRNDPARCDGERGEDESDSDREESQDGDSDSEDQSIPTQVKNVNVLSDDSDDSFRRLRDRVFLEKSKQMRALLEKHDQDVINIWFTLHTNPTNDLDGARIPDYEADFFYPGSGCLLQSSEVFADRKKDLRLLDQFIVEEKSSGCSGGGGFGGGNFGGGLLDEATMEKIANANYGVPEVQDTDLVAAFADCMRERRKGNLKGSDVSRGEEETTKSGKGVVLTTKVESRSNTNTTSYLKTEEVAFMFRSQRVTHRSCQYVHREESGNTVTSGEGESAEGQASVTEINTRLPRKVKRNNMEARFLVLNEGGLCEFAKWGIDLARRCEELLSVKSSLKSRSAKSASEEEAAEGEAAAFEGAVCVTGKNMEGSENSNTPAVCKQGGA